MKTTSRQATSKRETRETTIELRLNLDGRGELKGSSGVGFLDHLLGALVFHSRMDLVLKVAKSDLEIDDHHTIEDIGIVLGQALQAALGAKKGITRFGESLLPMDDALVQTAVDVGGRFWFSLNDSVGQPFRFRRENIGALSTEVIAEFLRSVAVQAGFNLHTRVLAGDNEHHIAEALFKSLGRALRQAIALDPDFAQEVPSTKGAL